MIFSDFGARPTRIAAFFAPKLASDEITLLVRETIPTTPRSGCETNPGYQTFQQ
jgi:hypothetical protein